MISTFTDFGAKLMPGISAVKLQRLKCSIENRYSIVATCRCVHSVQTTRFYTNVFQTIKLTSGRIRTDYVYRPVLEWYPKLNVHFV